MANFQDIGRDVRLFAFMDLALYEWISRVLLMNYTFEVCFTSSLKMSVEGEFRVILDPTAFLTVCQFSLSDW